LKKSTCAGRTLSTAQLMELPATERGKLTRRDLGDEVLRRLLEVDDCRRALRGGRPAGGAVRRVQRRVVRR
jgi:hypothetical protein